MAAIDVTAFCAGIGNVDRDLREMALFDLQRALQGPVVRLDGPNAKVIVDCLLRCFSTEEPHREVRNSAVQVVPHLLLVCSEKEQNRLSAFLCNCATSQRAQFGEKGYSEISDSAAFALKKCCELMSERARAHVEDWQRLAPLARNITGLLVSKLQESSVNISRDNMYDCISTLIYPFGRIYMCDVGIVITRIALSDISSKAQFRRRAIQCLSLASPLLDENAFDELRGAAFSAVRRGSGCGIEFLAYLQLCEAMVKHCHWRIVSVAPKALEALIAQMEKHITEVGAVAGALDDEEVGVCDAMARVINLLVSKFPTELSSIHMDVFRLCTHLVKFVQNAYGDASKDDESAESGDCGQDVFEDEDMTWKVREWAVRLFSTLVEVSPHSGEFIRRWECACLFALHDHEEVQLVSFELLCKLLGRAGAYNEILPTLPFRDLLISLLKCLGGPKAKTAAGAAKVLRLLCASHGRMVSRECVRLQSVLEGVLTSHSGGVSPLYVEFLLLAFQVLETMLAEGVEAHLMAPVLGSILGVMENPVTGSSIKVFLSYMETVAGAARVIGVPYNECCLQLLLSLNERNTTDAELDCAINKAVEQCFFLLAPSLSVEYIRVYMYRLVRATQVYPSTIGLLGALTSRSTTSLLSAEQVEQLCDDIDKHDCLGQREILRIVQKSLAVGLALSTKTREKVLNFVLLNVLSGKDYQLLQVGLEALVEACRMYPDFSERVGETALHILWDVLHTAALATSASFYGDVVRSAVPLVQVLCEQCSAGYVADLLEAVLLHISSSPQPEADVNLLEGIARCDGVLDKVAAFFKSETSLFFLCLGTVGQYQVLTEECRDKLVSQLTCTGSERDSYLSLLSVGRAGSNVSNESLVSLLMERATSEAQNRAVFWRGVREVAVFCPTRHADSCFHNASFRQKIVQHVLEGLVDDNVDAAAALLSSLTLYSVEDVVAAVASHLEETSEECATVTCIVAVRHALAIVSGGSLSPAFAAVVEKSLLLLKRTASVRVRLATLQLFSGLILSNSDLLFSSAIRDNVFPSVLAELLEDPTLLLTVDLGGYVHRNDRGFEVRKQAFDCIASLLCNSQCSRGVAALKYYGRHEELTRCLVHACGPQEKGETDLTLCNHARLLLVQLLRLVPRTLPQDSTFASLHVKLKAALEAKHDFSTADGAKKRTSLKHALYCVMRITELPPFSHSPLFQSLLFTALQSPLLPDSLRELS
ncbi:putative TATA binding protein interacting (TIP20) [Trypanosoma vivax]|uniref:TATA-binding protein interacting (TIP20) domain-containing protein n=1 Tax=Trypanosoma vivax (strain Y486) TaxID=1055687 RepID=G0U9W0_TRYVY|nr:hypothetical protein TRVL_02110 [Trypanosoma vivax]KAH8619122.1 putative TATA binding protein interacting (TIP20) [Trypanosoma vivax]CCC52591.1 conserved hypothetical protein [Trypanosoma vivax Y486]